MEEDRPQDENAEQEPSSPPKAGSPRLHSEGMRIINEAVTAVGWSPEEDDEAWDGPVNASPLVRMANAILATGIDARASAIHCEPDRRNLRIRVRIDGTLAELMALPKHIEPPLLRRYLIMADLNPFSRNPQMGTIPVKYANQDYTIRLSSLPSMHGTSQVLKIYDDFMPIVPMKRLGIPPMIQAITEDALARPGLFLVVGPSDSGRTTTAYNLVWWLNTLERNTLAVEELPGYRLSGVTQIYANQMRGIPHVQAIASARNLTPDTLFVGDITNREVAEEAVSAAESGTTVIGVIGASDAVGGIQALMRLGISPERIAGVVSGILAQRLARLLCTHCREPYETEAPGHFHYLLPDALRNQPITLHRATGCEECRKRGYWNRMGLFETLPYFSSMRDTLLQGTVTPMRLREAARLSGMQPLATLAWEWAQEGRISVEEAITIQAGLPVGWDINQL